MFCVFYKNNMALMVAAGFDDFVSSFVVKFGLGLWHD